MNLSEIKLIVSDMDGTLLDSNGHVSALFFELFETLKKHDIRFVAASGRQYYSIRHKLEAIEHDIHIIAENGGITMHRGEELAAVVMEKEKIKTALEACGSIANSHVVLCGKKGAYIQKSSETFAATLAEYYSQFQIVADLAAVEEDEFMKIAVYHEGGSEHYSYPMVKHLEGDFLVKVSAENWLDISLPETNKGLALSHLQKAWKITKEETAVFGDYNNDLEMLALAKYSFAMANAHPNVKSAARYTTKSNDDNGVEHIIAQVIAAKTT